MFHSAETYTICLTPDKFAPNERQSAQAYCEAIASLLCSLEQMKDVWDGAYYSDSRWGMYDTANRDARVTECGKYAGDECYSEIYLTTYVIPNTPRPSAKQPAYCCS